jgi:hypothetical protein
LPAGEKSSGQKTHRVAPMLPQLNPDMATTSPEYRRDWNQSEWLLCFVEQAPEGWWTTITCGNSVRISQLCESRQEATLRAAQIVEAIRAVNFEPEEDIVAHPQHAA